MKGYYYNPYEPWIQSLRLGPRSYPLLDPPPTKGAIFNMADYLPKNVGDLILWVDNWLAVLTAAPTDFELTSGDVTATGVKITAFKNSVADVVNLKDQLAAAVGVQTAKRADMESDLRGKGRVILPAPGITDSNKQLAGYTIRDTTPSDIIPIPVANVAVHGTSDGINHLVWDINGNKRGTDYNIEALIGTSTTWVMVGHTQKSRWDHENQIPGVKVIYRIRSQRSNRISGPSNEAIVYGS